LLRQSSHLGEVFKLVEPRHVESLVLVEGHAFNKRAQMFVHTKAFKIFGQARLNAFVKGGELGAGVGAHLSLKTVEANVSGNLVGNHHTVVVDLSVH
jgi:hypothetical protein